MLIIIHLLVGNVLFFSFLWKRERFLALYARAQRILHINAQLKNPKMTQKESSYTLPLAERSQVSIGSFIVFYLQFVSIAWMLFLSTFTAAAIVYRINPKIKELL